MNENFRPSDVCLALTKESEGLRLKAYPDPKSGGEPWTIAYGHTKGVSPGMTCTVEQAEQWLKEDYDEVCAVIARWVTQPLEQRQGDAVADFIYNMGPGAPGVKDGFVWLRNGNHSTLLRKLNAGDMAGAALEFEKWDASGPPGLIIRHRRQRELFQTGHWA